VSQNINIIEFSLVIRRMNLIRVEFKQEARIHLEESTLLRCLDNIVPRDDVLAIALCFLENGKESCMSFLLQELCHYYRYCHLDAMSTIRRKCLKPWSRADACINKGKKTPYAPTGKLE